MGGTGPAGATVTRQKTLAARAKTIGAALASRPKFAA